MSKLNSLGFLKEATEAKDGSDGLMYCHHWGTGFQNLIFKSHEEANEWIKGVNDSLVEIFGEDDERE